MIKNSSIFILLIICQIVSAQNKAWQPLGPSPIYGGQPELVSGDQQLGAINAIAPHPTNSNILWVASVAGGAWITYNGRESEPTWFPMTDRNADFNIQESLSTSDVTFDPLDSLDYSTMIVSYGRYSNFARVGGKRIGIIRSTNWGFNWENISGSVMAGKNINSVEARGSVIIASVDDSDSDSCNDVGIFRSDNTGASWTQMLNGKAYALEADPVNLGTFYAAIHQDDCPNATSGIYKTIDEGRIWTLINDPGITTLLATNKCSDKFGPNEFAFDYRVNFKLSVGKQNNVFAAIVCQKSDPESFSKSELKEVFRSGDGGATWSSLGKPYTNDFNGGLHPGGQGLNTSLVADPTNSNIVYIGGDRQPRINSSLGNLAFSGRIFKGDASKPLSEIWSPLTHTGTASKTAPHADSRDMKFDSAGTLLQSDDGGLYRMLFPRTSTSDWISVHGNLMITEVHSSAYDSISNIVLTGNQDNGTSAQSHIAEKNGT